VAAGCIDGESGSLINLFSERFIKNGTVPEEMGRLLKRAEHPNELA
jgi:hypothetical protein